MKRWSQVAWPLFWAAAAAIVVFLSLAPGARAGQGRGTLYGGVTSLGGSPASYRLSVNSTSGVTVGDHLMAAISGGGSGVWEVSALTSTTITVEDSLTEEHGGAFGAPVGGGPNGVFAYSTPTATGLTLIPDGALYWTAALRRNVYLTSTDAAAQTPWAANVNGAGYSLSGVLNLTTTGSTQLGSGVSSVTTFSGPIGVSSSVGTAGQVLTSGGPAAAMTWTTPAQTPWTSNINGAGYSLSGFGLASVANTGTDVATVLTAADSGKVETDEGALGDTQVENLPAAAAGLHFWFVDSDADGGGMRINAQAGDTISLGGTTSASGGYIISNQTLSVVHLVAVDSTRWIGSAWSGTWAVGSTNLPLNVAGNFSVTGTSEFNGSNVAVVNSLTLTSSGSRFHQANLHRAVISNQIETEGSAQNFFKIDIDNTGAFLTSGVISLTATCTDGSTVQARHVLIDFVIARSGGLTQITFGTPITTLGGDGTLTVDIDYGNVAGESYGQFTVTATSSLTTTDTTLNYSVEWQGDGVLTTN